jgi:hypothetical protein
VRIVNSGNRSVPEKEVVVIAAPQPRGRKRSVRLQVHVENAPIGPVSGQVARLLKATVMLMVVAFEFGSLVYCSVRRTNLVFEVALIRPFEEGAEGGNFASETLLCVIVYLHEYCGPARVDRGVPLSAVAF